MKVIQIILVASALILFGYSIIITIGTPRPYTSQYYERHIGLTFPSLEEKNEKENFIREIENLIERETTLKEMLSESNLYATLSFISLSLAYAIKRPRKERYNQS